MSIRIASARSSARCNAHGSFGEALTLRDICPLLADELNRRNDQYLGALLTGSKGAVSG